MLPSSALQLLHGNCNHISHTNSKGGRLKSRPLCVYSLCPREFILESHQSDLVLYPVWGRADEKEPLCEIVGHHDQISSVWDRFHEFVPCQDEVREYKQDCSYCEQGAPLHQGCDHHSAYEAGVDTHTDADHSRFCSRNHLHEYE